MKKAYVTVLSIALLSLVVILVYIYNSSITTCAPIPTQPPTMGKHGWDTWRNTTYISFKPEATSYCVEAGWEPIGATVVKNGTAQFPQEGNAIFVKTDGFITTPITLPDNRTTIRVVYSKELESAGVTEYINIIHETFKNVSNLYAYDDLSQLQDHVVLIGSGIAGDGLTDNTSINPPPTAEMTVFIRDLLHARSEELFIHAVIHLFNRFLSDNLQYQELQAPIPKGDWQEVEASWAEIALGSNNITKRNRVNGLYKIHEAVFTGTHTESLLFPFNDFRVFSQVKQKSIVLTASSTYEESEYGHYVLAPLLLVAVDGILEQRGATTSVADLIAHARVEQKNFFSLLSNYVSPEDLIYITAYIEGNRQIPYNQIEAGLKRYNN